MKDNETHKTPSDKKITSWLVDFIIILIFFLIIVLLIHVTGRPIVRERIPIVVMNEGSTPPKVNEDEVWQAPEAESMYEEVNADLISYGKTLIANTSRYFGPKGIISQTTNGMNCQNCHLEAGTRPFGNNYSAVASTYPKYRERSGKIETIHKRINDCFERSLNGKALDTLSNEMRAIIAYIKWLGKNVDKGERPKGAGILELAYLERAADPEKGRVVYKASCQNCHGGKGEGLLTKDGFSYKYPPLWGENSYNTGAGLYRLSRFAGYVKTSMPQGATYKAPQLSDEQAWDVAAYVNSQPRPAMNIKKDWPIIAKKPVDHPFGPYADSFSERQHKYGPFGSIVKTRSFTKK